MSLMDYEKALQRLIKGKPIVVPVGTKISNDSVSLEAGRARGSIKRSRASHASLLKDIREAKEALASPLDQQAFKLNKQITKTKTYKELYEESLGRELNLMQKEFERTNGTGAINL